MSSGSAALLLRSPLDGASAILGGFIRVGLLVNHFARNQIVLNFGIAVGEASPLFFLLITGHFYRSGPLDERRQFFCHGKPPKHES
jgi:hypothetical protein